MLYNKSYSCKKINLSFIKDLQKLIKQPSISSKNFGLIECANLLAQIMNKSGIQTELIFLEKDNRKIPPIIFGEVRSQQNPQGKTILFYNHYDVQPIEPAHMWQRNPFSGEIEGNKIFGRGSSDDKGEIICRIRAVEELLKRNGGDLPCNIKFVIEGEEEIGSPNLYKYLQKIKHKIQNDGMIWEFGYVDWNNRPVINLGMKGMLYVHFISHGPSVDLHSSLAVIVKNPAWNLLKALNSIWDNTKGHILIKGWYDEISSISTPNKSGTLTEVNFNEKEFKQKYNIKHFLGNKKGNQIKYALSEMPSCNISSFSAGYLGEGSKTIIPSYAQSKIDFRLVPKMDPEKHFSKLKKHLHENNFSDIEIKYLHGIKPSRTNITNSFVKMIIKSANLIYGKKPIVNPSSAGSGPMSLFTDLLNCPVVSIGCTPIFANIHSVNEYARIDLLQKGIDCFINILCNMSKY